MSIERYELVRQGLSEARRTLCRTLRALNSPTLERVVVVEKRGKPLAAILSAPEAQRYFAWKAAYLREQEDARATRDLLEGWPELEDYIRRSLARGVSPRELVELLLKHYSPPLVDRSRAERIVDLIGEEEEMEK